VEYYSAPPGFFRFQDLVPGDLLSLHRPSLRTGKLGVREPDENINLGKGLAT